MCLCKLTRGRLYVTCVVFAGPWSGLSMHPVESTLYYTCVLIHCCFLQHPAMFMFNKLHCDLSPIPGHHGASHGLSRPVTALLYHVLAPDPLCSLLGFSDYLGGKFHNLVSQVDYRLSSQTLSSLSRVQCDC